MVVVVAVDVVVAVAEEKDWRFGVFARCGFFFFFCCGLVVAVVAVAMVVVMAEEKD